jgi:septum site-determining protein MinC
MTQKDRDDIVGIKGIREGLLLTLNPDGGTWDAMTTRLMARIDEKPAFFKGARAALDVADRPVLPHELESVRLALIRRNITLWAVISASPITQQTARQMKLETSLVAQDEQLETPEVSSEVQGEASIMITQTLRSGRTVRYAGHVIIYGDVNPGAQIIAGGNVIVWGRLKGLVHAGANGDENALVCALDLAPTQLRIAHHITVSPEDKRRKVRPEIATVRNGRIVAEAWNG